MPKQEQIIMLSGIDKETALAISYQAFKNLGWSVLFAGEEKILGQTIKKWNSNPQQVIIGSDGHILNISSEMIKGESFDLSGKNKKNIAAFLTAFEAAKNNIKEDTIEANTKAINELRTETITVTEKEQKEKEEVDKAMNLSNSNLYITYALIIINILVFTLMVINGAGIFNTNGLVHIKWGSNFSPLTLSGDWWRLITNTFIHFGIIHIAMNMYCLYIIGSYLEPMLGKVKYITAYLCTGVLASLVSLWWHKDGINSAGASGAIFGMYGLFLALLTTDLIPKKVRQALLQSIGIFVFYNLAYGVKSGVDNAAHIGGLVSGFIFGYLYVISLKKEKTGQKVQWILPLIILITIGFTTAYLNNNKASAENRQAVLNEVKSSEYKDGKKYIDRMNEFSSLEEKALAPLEDKTQTDSTLKDKIKNISLPAWTRAEEELELTQSYDISESMHAKITKLFEYVQLRREELNIIIQMIETKNQQQLIPSLNEVRTKMNALSLEIQKL